MKKILLTLGATASVVAPMATVVACTNAPVDNIDRFYKNRLEDWLLEDEDDLSRYVDIENKMLLWDNIKEDGFDSVNLDKNGWHIDSVIVDENWLSNTDMNIPTWVKSVGSTFVDAIINKPIHIPKEMVNEWYDALGTSDEGGRWNDDPHFQGAFYDSVINEGITFEEGIKHIPASIARRAIVNNGFDTDYKIHIPSSVEYIGARAFDNIETDVIDYDFSHLTNWYIDDRSYDLFSSEIRGWLKGVEITLPLFSRDLPEDFFISSASIFGHYDGEAPNLVKYNSIINWTYAERELFTTDPSQTGWSNRY